MGNMLIYYIPEIALSVIMGDGTTGFGIKTLSRYGKRHLFTTHALTLKRGVRRGGVLLLAATLLFTAATARGGEEDVYAEIRRQYEIVNAELQYLLREMDCPSDLPEYPERLLSLRRNASVAIGGEMRANYIATKGSYLDPNPGNPLGGGRRRTRSKLSSLGVTSANIDMEIRAGDRWRAYVDINLNGYHGFNRIARLTNPNAPGQPVRTEYDRERPVDIIDAAYLELLKSGHSGFGFRAGIMKLPFGLGKRPNLIGKSFMDAPDLSGSYLMAPDAWDNGVRLPHASRAIDPSVAFMATYEMRDIIRFEAALFQDSEGARRYSRDGSRYRSYHSDSSLPRSWQVGFSILPLEGWELSAYFRNRYSKSRGVHYWADSPYRWDFLNNLASSGRDPSWDPITGQWSDGGTGASFGSRSNEQAFIVGLAVEIPNTNWTVQAEYAHGWNQGFNKYLNSDGVNLALSYRLTPFLTLHAQGEWLHLKDRSWMADTASGWQRDTRNNHLYRTLFGAEYELFRGLTLEAGWQYEYWRLSSSKGGSDGGRDRRVNTANTAYMGTRFIF